MLGALNEIGRRYGVEPSVMVAIWGKETSYGVVTGDFDLLNSLASLAYEGRRRELFADEFVATLKMMERGFPRSQLKGSWAGATGYPQFLPSVYLRLAVDGDGDGRADIWNSQLDALASIANYLSNAGWKPNVPWGVPARCRTASPRRGCRQPLTRAALPARVRAPQPLADAWASGGARRRAAGQRSPDTSWRRCSSRTARAARLSAHHQLPHDPRL
jgi:membrane-bound lytic murein transglycosylase B